MLETILIGAKIFAWVSWGICSIVSMTLVFKSWNFTKNLLTTEIK